MIAHKLLQVAIVVVAAVVFAKARLSDPQDARHHACAYACNSPFYNVIYHLRLFLYTIKTSRRDQTNFTNPLYTGTKTRVTNAQSSAGLCNHGFLS